MCIIFFYEYVQIIYKIMYFIISLVEGSSGRTFIISFLYKSYSWSLLIFMMMWNENINQKCNIKINVLIEEKEREKMAQRDRETWLDYKRWSLREIIDTDVTREDFFELQHSLMASWLMRWFSRRFPLKIIE